MSTVVVVTAGISQPSSTRLLADRLAEATERALAELGPAPQIEIIELREHARDLANRFVTGYPSASLNAVLETVAGADAVIAVTPIFSASYSGLFKMFFDVVDPGALRGKPVLIGATGGTARHSLALDHALRPLFSYLRAVVIPTGVYAASEDWASDGDLRARIDRAADELATALGRNAAAPTGTGDAFANVVPFERLLAGGQPRRASGSPADRRFAAEDVGLR